MRDLDEIPAPGTHLTQPQLLAVLESEPVSGGETVHLFFFLSVPPLLPLFFFLSSLSFLLPLPPFQKKTKKLFVRTLEF